MEEIGATPSPATKRPNDHLYAALDQHEAQVDTPAPVAKRHRTSVRDKAASALAAEAAKLKAEHEVAEAQAAEAEHEAAEAMAHAKELGQRSAELKVAAQKMKEKVEQAMKQAERAELERTAQGRALAKQQDKAAKKEAQEAARIEKQNDKNEAATTRTAVKDMGDAIKGSMRIAKIGGLWSVPPGNVSFRGVKFSTFKAVFARGRCKFSPENYCPSDPTISLITKDAASIFGSTKVCGGSMYATFTITKMQATYTPAKEHLMISYDTDGF